jgi:hypothetical protein
VLDISTHKVLSSQSRKIKMNLIVQIFLVANIMVIVYAVPQFGENQFENDYANIPERASFNCYDPKSPGRCEAYFPRFYFNAQTGKCERFIWGGCQANGNNFGSRNACEKACVKKNDYDY